MDDDQFKRLLDALDLSWQGYRKVRKGIKKRLSRHMEQTGCRSVEDYVKRIGNRTETRLLMTVSTSRFFRDRTLWKALEEKIIPEILSRSPDRVRVWSAGCALGQEVYSFRMLWEFMKMTQDILPALFLLATDIHPEYLRRAIEGEYRTADMRAVPDDIRDQCLALGGDRYVVSERLRSDISWEIYDLTDSPDYPDSFQIIFLRNSLLTYYKQNIQEAALPRIVDNLAGGGYLIVGLRERLPAAYPALVRSDAHPCIYSKEDSPNSGTGPFQARS
ncbi:MAG: hypothetical protein JW950_13305 [Deltaproteobacteria bacterium]|nr:hypothetical protein [Deltaproteobacteria bacterium]